MATLPSLGAVAPALGVPAAHCSVEPAFLTQPAFTRPASTPPGFAPPSVPERATTERMALKSTSADRSVWPGACSGWTKRWLRMPAGAGHTAQPASGTSLCPLPSPCTKGAGGKARLMLGTPNHRHVP
eukprot:scaffold4173_cov117-Isochrysis_galbana.AAC.11